MRVFGEDRLKEKDVCREALCAAIQPAFYRRVENLVDTGCPDVYVCIDGVSAWVEVKYCRATPARLTTSVFKNAHPLNSDQENWLYDHWRKGGRGFIFARVEEWFVLVPAHMAFDFNALTVLQLENFRVSLDMLRYEISSQVLVCPRQKSTSSRA